MTRIHIFFMLLVLVIAAACGGTDSNVGSEDTAAADAATASSSQPARQKPAPQPPKPQFSTLAAGTVIAIRLQDPLDTSVNKTGDTFRAVVDQDILVGNSVVVPRGSSVDGKLTFVQQSGRVKGRAAMSMQLQALHVGNQTYPLESEVLSFEADATKKEDAAKVGIGSGIGAVVGAIAGGGKGAAIGAAVGAGAGGATVAATRGKELRYGVEHPFEFTLNSDLSISK
ncbi:MAG: hypothetical protein P8Z37_00060 [Acidobacteriota bacterium]